MDIRVALLGGDELVRRGLDSMLKTLGGFELGTIKDRSRLPIDIALVETFGTARDTAPVPEQGAAMVAACKTCARAVVGRSCRQWPNSRRSIAIR